MNFKKTLWGLGCLLGWASISQAQGTPTVPSSSFSIEGATVTWSPSPWRVASNHAFGAGEDFFFVVRWGIVTGGYSTLAVHGIDRLDGRPAFHLVEEAHSAGVVDTFYKVHDRNDAWLDAQSLVTLQYEKHVKEGHYQIEETVTLDQEHHRYQDHSYRVDKGFYENKAGSLPASILDVLGSLYYIRTLPMVVGQSYAMDVYSGGKVWPLVVDVRKREKVSVPAGKFDCYLVEPLLREPGIFVSNGKKLEVWLTADDRRMPVLMRSEILIGHVSASLVSYHLTKDRLSVPPP